MKQFHFLALFAVGVASLAFAGSATSRQSPPPAKTYTVHETIVYDTVMTVDCIGEAMHLYGEVEVTHHLTINGNRFVERIVHVPRGVVGVGLTTGAQWIGAGQTQHTYIGSFAGGQSITGYVNAMIIIGKGRVENLLMHDNILSKVYEDGTVTTVVDHSYVECR